jgi:nucleoside-diphosphate-sugar epimerase
MQIVITGGAGFLGKKLARAILDQDGIAIDGDYRGLERLRLVDVTTPADLPADPRVEVVTTDLSQPAAFEAVVDPTTDVVFHLAAVVSAAAEADFDLGMAVNLEATMALLERCRALPEPPRLIFASSVAVYGGPVVRGTITDTTHLVPQTSYGVQKAVGELLVTDYHRKGFIDGRSLRLPTIVVRPGKPNKAASTWASSIIREPLAGREAVCPVSRDTAMFVLSPRRVVDAFLHAADLASATLGVDRTVQLPGRTFTVAEMLRTLEAVAGAAVAARVRFEPDDAIQRICDGWARSFETTRAHKLGFRADTSFREIVEAHLEDERGGRIG